MEDFLKYFEDKKFVQWIIDPDDELDNFWKDYLKNNPSEKEQVEFSYILLSQLKSKKEADIANKGLNLLSEIINRLEQNREKQKTRKIYISILKYVAVAILFFSL